MKKTFILAVSLALLVGTLPGQTISKQEAQELLQKAITSLQNSDQGSFVNLWYLTSNRWFSISRNSNSS